MVPRALHWWLTGAFETRLQLRRHFHPLTEGCSTVERRSDILVMANQSEPDEAEKLEGPQNIGSSNVQELITCEWHPA